MYMMLLLKKQEAYPLLQQLQKQQLRQQVQTQQQENDALQKSIDQGGSQEEMERIARDELGLVSPGERVFVDIGH